MNYKRVERIWRQEGLKMPQKQPKRARLWLKDGSCVRRRPERPNHVWAYNFCADRTHDGRPLRMLVVVDEFTRECLSIDVSRKLKSDDVLDRLTELFVGRGLPEHIRSDNGPEFTSKGVREWLLRLGVKTLFIEPGSRASRSRTWHSQMTRSSQRGGVKPGSTPFSGKEESPRMMPGPDRL